MVFHMRQHDRTCRPLAWLLAAVLALGGLGCWPQHQVGYRPPEPETPAERNFEVVWQAVRDVLESHRFEINRQDRRAGVMTTEALVGQQFFEFWRKDAATVYSYGENSVQTIFRAAKVTIHPVENSDKFDFTVQVAIARSDKGAQQLSDASQAMVVHGGVDVSRREDSAPNINAILTYEDLLAPRSPRAVPRAPVVPLGFDRRLEEVLAHEIRVASAGYVYSVPEPVQYTDPGELLPSTSPPPPGPQGPNPALPESPPPMPNPAGGNDNEEGAVEVRLLPAAESVDADAGPEDSPTPDNVPVP